mgnify:CR=1 FL=1
MRYIELYLNEREKELKKEKEKEIAKFISQYRDCTTNEQYETLIEDCNCSYNPTIDWVNMRLDEIKKLREDLVGSDKE